MSSKVFSFLVLVRPLNILLGMAAIFLGAFISGAVKSAIFVILASLSGGLIMAAGNVLNDYCDIDIDRINKPFRPLPSNQISREEAWIFSNILFVLGIFLSILINYLALSIAIFTVAGLIVYGFWLKRTILLGNIAVSFFSGLAFVYGGVSVGRWQESMIPGVFAFFFHLGREIIKDVEDESADKFNSVQTLPICIGGKNALVIASIVYVMLIIFTFVPYLMGTFGKGYFWLVLVGVDIVIFLTLTYMWVKPIPETLRKISAILKADMIVGLIAIYIGYNF